MYRGSVKRKKAPIGTFHPFLVWAVTAAVSLKLVASLLSYFTAKCLIKYTAKIALTIFRKLHFLVSYLVESKTVQRRIAPRCKSFPPRNHRCLGSLLFSWFTLPSNCQFQLSFTDTTEKQVFCKNWWTI